ncbi:hypothetical protein [Kutzneria kofuensis]|uniref:hypothetical protein n=1 Tax=Kutzneria kofuensis TaxID=103725 RepID=UPI003CD099DE
MTAAVGWPVLVQQFHGTPGDRVRGGHARRLLWHAVHADGGELQHRAGGVLLEMKDRYGPIKAQLPTAVCRCWCATSRSCSLT